ncbi:MAG: DNA double-strand break repair nuclease NurA [Anaerolineae bacterium]
MPNFIDKLTLRVEEKAGALSETLRREAEAREEALRQLLAQHWHELPSDLEATDQRPAYAVDGSLRRANLANGAYLFAAQALLMGEDIEETAVEVEILRGSTPRASVERFADLLLQRLEVGLACQCASQVPEGSVLFLDGALYGQLPQLYPLTIEGVRYPLPDEILNAYLQLFQHCCQRRIDLISIAKTSREATHSKIWQREAKVPIPLDIPDSEMIYRWTDSRAGYSTPVILGTWGFTRGSRELLKREELSRAPAIVSFFVRLSDFDDAVRVDLPATALGSDVRLGDVSGDILDLDRHDLRPVLQVLAADYGGLEVYNALLYTVDREVRLERRMMRDVYLKLIGQKLGCEIRLDRSERRF